jgi:hypothetical protein
LNSAFGFQSFEINPNAEIYGYTMAIDHTVARDRHRGEDFMVFRDNFVEVQPGFLIDPLLKLRRETSRVTWSDRMICARRAA